MRNSERETRQRLLAAPAPATKVAARRQPVKRKRRPSTDLWLDFYTQDLESLTHKYVLKSRGRQPQASTRSLLRLVLSWRGVEFRSPCRSVVKSFGGQPPSLDQAVCAGLRAFRRVVRPRADGLRRTGLPKRATSGAALCALHSKQRSPRPLQRVDHLHAEPWQAGETAAACSWLHSLEGRSAQETARTQRQFLRSQTCVVPPN